MKKAGSFFRAHVQFTVFLCLALVLILTAVFAPFIAPQDPYNAVFSDALKPPGSAHLLGTDKLGRDLLSRIIYGTRTSLVSALFLVVIILLAGTVLGILAGWFDGWPDALIMRLADMMIAFPGMVLAIAIAGILGAGMFNAIMAIAVVSWPKYARLARSLVLKIKNEDYVYAAKVDGATTRHLLLRYMLNLTVPTLIITAATDIGTMMLEIASLSFLGFGAQSPTAEWGLMLNEGRLYMQSAPWLFIFPGIAIFITVAVFNVLGDSLRDVMDVRNNDQG